MINNAKVFYLNSYTKDNHINEQYMIISEDKNFIIVNFNEDKDIVYKMFKYMEYTEYESSKSIEDEIYDNFLIEANVVNESFDNMNFIIKEIDEKTNKLVIFNTEIGIINCVIDLELSKTTGSNIIYAIGINENNLKKSIVSVQYEHTKG